MSHIGYVTTTFPTLARFVESDVAGLVRAGHRVTVFALRPTGRRYQPEHEALLPLVRPVGNPFSAAAWPALGATVAAAPTRVAADVARLLASSLHDPYALAGHAAYLPAAFRVARAARREGITRLHGAWAHFPATVAWLAARWSGARFSFSAHAGADLFRSRTFLAAKLRAADFVATCVRGNREVLAAAAPGAAGKVHCIYHGIDLARFDGAGRAPAPLPLFLSVGALRPAKGFADAVEALGLLRQAGVRARYVIVGEGGERAALERRVARLGLGAEVELPGERTHREILPLYRSAWAVLAPSVVMADGRRDGIPNVVVEAMAMGVPCVATRAAGLEEAVQDGVTGWLAPPGEPAGLARCMRRVVERREEAEALGDAGRRRARAEFDAARNFARLLQLFERRWEEAPAAGAAAAVRATV